MPNEQEGKFTEQQLKDIERGVNELERRVQFQFSQIDNSVVQSPEDRVDKENAKMMTEMGKCRNLDYFFDVVFELDGKHLIKANSAVLLARCEYFQIMFDSKYGFKESTTASLDIVQDHQNVSKGSQTVNKQTGVRQVKVRGIPREYFIAIIQYLYTDEFC